MPLLTPDDYKVGILQIATNKINVVNLLVYITDFEKNYLQELLGCDLYDLYVADLDGQGNPQTQRFIDIYDEFCIDEDDCGIQWKSEGIFQMTKEFVYWEYVRNQPVTNTSTGDVANQNEVSRETSSSETRIYRTYNEAINTYRAIQWFICDNETVYPEYNGINKRKTSWF